MKALAKRQYADARSLREPFRRQTRRGDIPHETFFTSREREEAYEVLFDARAIARRVRALGRTITRDYSGRGPLFVGVLRGAAVFLSDLVRSTNLPLRIDFIALSSYGSATETSGQVRLVKDLETSIEGTEIILVEDIVDTGLTLNYLIGNLQSRNPKSVKVCALLSKPSRRRVDVRIDYLGFEVPDRFVIGYGLDFDQRFRHLPCIAALKGSPPRDGPTKPDR